MREKFKNVSIGKVKIIGEKTEKLPMWAINYFIEELCNNYNKILLIKRICQLMQEGSYDAQFWVAKRSADLFPNKPIMESFVYDEEKYILLSLKSENPEKFWHIITNYIRPVVFYRKKNGDVIPLTDYKDEDAVKVIATLYNSPIEISVMGEIGALYDIVHAKERREQAEIEHINKQIGQTAINYERIVSASQVVNKDSTPDGVKHYANIGLMNLLKKQEILNDKLGIKVDSIDTRI